MYICNLQKVCDLKHLSDWSQRRFNEHLYAISSVFLTAPTNDEMMILLVRRAKIKRESLVRRSLC